MGPHSSLRQLRDDIRGATLMEFGLIILPLCLFIMGVGDLGYQSYLRSVAQGVLDRAARAASVGTLNKDQIDAYIDSQMQAINAKNGTTSVVKKSYYNFSRVEKPEKITSDTPPLGSFNQGDCFEDSNGNGTYDTSAGAIGLGGADDIVFYEVTVKMPRLFPMAKLLGWDPEQKTTAKATIRNQPWSNQATLPVICT